MLQKLLRLYMAFMAFDERGALPVLVGPPGSGKSSVAQELSELLGVELHILSVARMPPLEVEGIQVPRVTDKEIILEMVPATFWARLKEGDVVLFDEFLRGFDEVYNALLDIFTSRRAGAFRLPKVFMVGASNSIAGYDEALDDRMLPIPVADPRKRKAEASRIKRILVDQIGLHPDMESSFEMQDLMDKVVLPTFDVLDHLFDAKGRKSGDIQRKGKSVRNLVSQAHLRYVVTPELKALIEENNRLSIREGKEQYVVLLGTAPKGYKDAAMKIAGNPKLTQVQRTNVALNLEMIELSELRTGRKSLEEEEEV